jgi:transcriptional regulator with XRE-family HTH domain
MMSTRMPDPLDAMVGAKIRIFRIHRRISQTDLAEQIGVTFQQVQKYEKGTNRVGASRLSRIAAVLGISVGELFEPSVGKSDDEMSPFRLLAEPGALRVLKAYTRTTDPHLRRVIAELVEGIADQSPLTKSPNSRSAAGKRGRKPPRT